MDKIRFGVSATLTGKYNIQGRESFNGLSLWIEEKNKSGGIYTKKTSKKIPVQLIHYDDNSNTENTELIIKKLIEKDNIDILLGPYSSSLTLAAAKVSDHYDRTLWNYGGSSDEIFTRGSKNIVSSITPASKYFNCVIELLSKSDLRAKEIATVFAKNSGFANQVANGAINCASDHDFDTIELTYNSGENNFKSILEKINEQNIKTILGVGRFEDDIVLAKEICSARHNFDVVCLIGSSIEQFKKQLGDLSEGFLSASQWEPNIKYKADFGPTSQDFSNLYKKKHGKKPDYTSAQAYNIGVIIEKLIDETGFLDEKTLRENALKTEFTTFYGKFKVDSKTGNQVGHKMLVTQWQSGSKEVLYPKAKATSNFLYPL